MVGSLFGQKQLWDDAYYHLMEVGFVSYLLSYYLLSSKDNVKFSKFWQTITLIILLSPVSTLIDEISYNALEVEFNDLVRITMIISTSFLIKYNKTWRTILKLLKKR